MHPPDPASPPQLPSWLTDLFQATTPAAAAGPTPTPPTGKTPEQDAQDVIAHYWRWAVHGQTTYIDKQGNAVDSPDKAQKDAKGEPLSAPIDPDTGLPDQNFPTIAQINAAESLLTRKQANDPAAVQAAKDQAKATLDETKTRTAQIQATIDKGTAPPATVQPGEGVRQPDGTYTVPVPTKAPGPTQTQAEIDQAAADARTKAERDAANSRTPEQTAQLELSNARALESQRAHDAIEAEKAKIQAQIDAGTLLPADAAAALKEKYDEINANFTSGLRQAEAKYTHDLAQPNLDRQFNLEQQTQQATQENNDRTRRMAEATGQADVLKAQSAQGQQMLDMEVKAGSATPISMASLKLAVSPLQRAFQIMQDAVRNGQAPASAIPTPAAPAPAATTPQAPAPAAPPPFSTAAPAPAIASERGALNNYPQPAY